ncbi:WD domain G-beta repeat [Phytophthora infestans]|uniref:WD domain G-beta repeat n=1 Tax=Phytophthora infestans TaxID=4787 RepID=A0A833WFB6_PHYIN|nr:WD domain G-beta repeat [Phytophthora infestans]
MGKKALKLESSTDGLGTRKKKSRPRKSLMRQHRRDSLRAEQPQSPEAESLLKSTEETQPHPSSQSGKSSQPPPQRAEEDESNDKNRAETQQNEPSPQSTARRSTFLSWRSRNSTTTIVEDAPPASCPLTCQPSSCFIGSLNGTISEMHLPLLTKLTKARMDALKASPKQRHLEVTIEHSDELPFGAYSHPQVRVHIVDRCTGRALCPPQMTSEAKFWMDNNASCNAFEWQQALSISVDMPTFLNTRTVLLFEILEVKAPSKGARFRRGKRFESVSTHDEDDEYPKAFNPTPRLDYRRIAWGFFHTITNKGTPTMNSFVLPDIPDANEKKKRQSIVDVCGLRVRLFEYQVMTWMDKYQAKLQWGWRKNHPTVPVVFLQYQKRSRVSAPSTLHVQLRATGPPAGALETTNGRIVENTDKELSTAAEIEAGDNQEPPTAVSAPDTGSQVAAPEAISSDSFDLMAPCKRNASEPCLIPQRVLCSLPSGKKGCSAVSFSPCGRFLAASVSPELGDFVVQVYHMTSAELFAVGRGHRGMIYSLQWSIISNGQYRLLSASSDGSVRLWNLPCKNEVKCPESHRTHLLSLVYQWHHFPSFVYSAIFLPGSTGEIVLTGASDGCMRFRKESSVMNGQPEYGMLQVSSAAVQAICVEAKSGRVFCGDANGEISVWRRTANASTLDGYERIKTIQTGQTSITSLKLHPRKAHLLAHTQPNAIFQYELRSYLLLNKSYAGVACESLLVKSTFSPDGKLVISGSEDGVPRLFTSLHGQQLQRGVWGTHFFHEYPVLDVSWSPTAHMAALCSYGGDNPIVVLCSYRGDEDAVYIDESASQATPNTTTNLHLAVNVFRGANQLERFSGDHAQRLQRALERRQKRLQAKLSLEAEASTGQNSNNLTSSVAV